MIIRFKSIKLKEIILFCLIISLSILTVVVTNSLTSDQIKTNNTQKIHQSGTTPHNNQLWVKNPTFSTTADPWYSSIEGDATDVMASYSANQANFEVIGDSGSVQVLFNNETYTNWSPFLRSDLEIVPQRASVPYYGVTADGAWCSHWWDENEAGGQPKNTPRMHWRTNVSLPVDMSDYIISDVNFNAIINASVNWNIDTPGDTQAKTGTSINQFQIYDYAQFYVEISTLDIDDLNTYRIAFNQTRMLGNEGLSLYNIEGNIGVFEEKAIIDALTNVLAADPGSNNFTIILGIYMYCEDNQSGTDLDQWNDLRFKSVNLTFSYVKRINKSTTLSWNQDLDPINGTNVQVTAATLSFKYKIDSNWTNASENSRMRVFINDRKYELPFNLIDYVYSPDFKEASESGFDIVSEILPYENFTLSIQVFLAEDFGLKNTITISITDVYLYISYTETTPDIIPEPWLFAGLFIIATMGAVTAVGYLIAYQLYLKYPVPVRKVRKYRRTLEAEKDPTVSIIGRERSFKRLFQKEMDKTAKFVAGVPLDGKLVQEKLLGSGLKKT